MKFSTTCFLLGLISIAAAAAQNAAQTTSMDFRSPTDPFAGETPDDIAPAGCSSATPFASCYLPVTSWWNCNDNVPCQCSSALIEQSCGAKYCSSDYNNADVSLYCTGTQTIIATPSPVAPSKAEATTTSSSHSAASSAAKNKDNTAGTEAHSAPSGSPASTAKPNAGARAVAGGMLAVAAAAAGALV